MRRGGMGCAGRPWAQGCGIYPGATHPPAMLTSRQPCGLPRTLSVFHECPHASQGGTIEVKAAA